MRTRQPFALLAAALICLLADGPAHAQRARVFVSVQGTDAGTCPALSPCRTFQFAHDQVQAGGEISVLNTGGYGPVAITKAVSVVSPLGVEASIATASGGIAITINAGPSDKVALRGLTLDGTALAGTGIQFNSGASLTVQDSFIRNFAGDGLDFKPTGGGNLWISNSVVSDNGSAGIAIYITDGDVARANINRVETNNNKNYGVFLWGSPSAGGFIYATVSESVSSGNSTAFYVLTDASHAQTTLSLFHSVTSYNGVGLFADGGGAFITTTQSLAIDNLVDLNINNAGVVKSFGDNYFGNVFGGNLTPINKQ
jgi:hypothetical protein